MNTAQQHPTLREIFGFTDEEVVALLVFQRAELSKLKKTRRVIYDRLIPLLGIQKEDFDKAKGLRWSKRIAQTLDAMSDEKNRIFGIHDIVRRSGPTKEEQEYFFGKVKEAVEKDLLCRLPTGFFFD